MKCTFNVEGMIVIEAENPMESIALQSVFGRDIDWKFEVRMTHFENAKMILGFDTGAERKD